MALRTKPTIRDVAARSGVSLTTVSYVLSGRTGGSTRISQATRDRVTQAAGELGYVPDHAARGMRRGRTDLVAVAIRDLEQPEERATAAAAAALLPGYGLRAVVLLGEDWRHFVLAGGADAAIVAGLPDNMQGDTFEHDHTVEELGRRGVPVLIVPTDVQGAFQDLEDGIGRLAESLDRKRSPPATP